MRIGGLNKFSLSDFPGRVATVVFTQGCNFRCPYCHNGSLLPCIVSVDSQIPEEKFFEFLKLRRGYLDAVVVSGGEPCIQLDLPTFLRKIKTMDFLLKLDTNGSNPELLKEIMENDLVDYIAMDIKAPLHMYDRLCGVHVPINMVKESIELISHSSIQHEFRTTVVKPLLSLADIRSIQKLVPSGSKHQLQKFCPEYAFDVALRITENTHNGESMI